MNEVDNDGLYVQGVFPSGEPTTIVNSSFFAGCDDAIDDNGAMLHVSGAWIDGWRHEGVAVSGFGAARAAEDPSMSSSGGGGGGVVTVRDSVIRRCGQGFEVGYGSARGEIRSTVVDSCIVGLRMGDNYLYRPSRSASLVATNVVVTRSTLAPVLDFVMLLDGPANALQVRAIGARCVGVRVTRGVLRISGTTSSE